MLIKCILLCAKSQSEKATYESKYMTFWKSQDCGDNKKISGCQGLGVRCGVNRRGTQDF